MKPEMSGYSIKKNGSTLVYSRQVGKMKVEHVFPVGIDPAAEEIIYDKFRRQIAELVIKDISKDRMDHS